MTNNTKHNRENEMYRQVFQLQEPAHITDLRRQLSESTSQATRIKNLYAAIMSADSESNSVLQDQRNGDLDLDCETCKSLLDMYGIDALKGYDLKSNYPLIWDHLQVCYCCQQTYGALIHLLDLGWNAESNPVSLSITAAEVRERLSFLELPSAAAEMETDETEEDGRDTSVECD